MKIVYPGDLINLDTSCRKAIWASLGAPTWGSGGNASQWDAEVVKLPKHFGIAAAIQVCGARKIVVAPGLGVGGS